jgi:hypothetical protein
MTCTECRFFGKAMRWSNVSGKMVEAMECRHNTPGDSGWPLVLNTDWCGAFESEQTAKIGVTP